jgi:phosphatidate cytidylyltransferase
MQAVLLLAILFFTIVLLAGFTIEDRLSITLLGLALSSIVPVAILMVIFLSERIDRNEVAASCALLLPSGLLLISGGSALLSLAFSPWPVAGILWAVLLVVATDSGAYFAGVRFGTHALNPVVSPKKTLEGALGGLLACLLLGVVLHFMSGFESVFASAGVSICISLAAQTGDLVKSLLKRSVGVKDSGSLLPGHGGVLDRFDGQLFAAPIFLAAVTVQLVILR